MMIEVNKNNSVVIPRMLSLPEDNKPENEKMRRMGSFDHLNQDETSKKKGHFRSKSERKLSLSPRGWLKEESPENKKQTRKLTLTFTKALSDENEGRRLKSPRHKMKKTISKISRSTSGEKTRGRSRTKIFVQRKAASPPNNEEKFFHMLPKLCLSLGIREEGCSKAKKYCFVSDKVTQKESFLLQYAARVREGRICELFDRLIQVSPGGLKNEAIADLIVKIMTHSKVRNLISHDLFYFFIECHNAEFRCIAKNELGSFLRGDSYISVMMKKCFSPLLKEALCKSTKRVLNFLSDRTKDFPVVSQESQLRSSSQELVVSYFKQKSFSNCSLDFFKVNLEILEQALWLVLEDTKDVAVYIPDEIKAVYRNIKHNCGLYFSEKEELAQELLTSFYILRFLNSYLTSPDLIRKYTSKKTDEHYDRFYRAMITLSSLIQWTAMSDVSEALESKIPEQLAPLFIGDRYEKRKALVKEINELLS